jgi:hypothetical protein
MKETDELDVFVLLVMVKVEYLSALAASSGPKSGDFAASQKGSASVGFR